MCGCVWSFLINSSLATKEINLMAVFVHQGTYSNWFLATLNQWEKGTVTQTQPLMRLHITHPTQLNKVALQESQKLMRRPLLVIVVLMEVTTLFLCRKVAKWKYSSEGTRRRRKVPPPPHLLFKSVFYQPILIHHFLNFPSCARPSRPQINNKKILSSRANLLFNLRCTLLQSHKPVLKSRTCYQGENKVQISLSCSFLIQSLARKHQGRKLSNPGVLLLVVLFV